MTKKQYLCIVKIERNINMAKNYYIMQNVGKARYLLNDHDGVSTHKDGSPFYGCEIFSNKKKLAARVKELRAQGYVERDEMLKK